MSGDAIDQACEREERDREIAIALRRERGPARRVDGECANECGDGALPGSAFCCPECRDDWQARRRVFARGLR
jgi:hypothetical protein